MLANFTSSFLPSIHTPIMLFGTVFYGATSFNVAIESWNVQLVANMQNMFRDSGYDTETNLCGWYWLRPKCFRRKGRSFADGLDD